MDPYAYVNGDPETESDPSGRYIAGPSGQTYYPGSPYYTQGGEAYSVKTGQPYNGNGFTNGWLPGYGPNALPKPTTDTVTLLNMCSQNPRCAAAFRDFHSRLAQEYLSVEFGIFAGVAETVAALLIDDPELMQQDEDCI